MDTLRYHLINTFEFRFWQTVLTRRNSLTGVEYRDDPTIFAWELINEPRCITDKSGDTLQVNCKFLILLKLMIAYLLHSTIKE